MSFQELGLSSRLLNAIEDQGYTQPTAIQTRAIPAVLGGTDILAAAQTGTGKTAAFTLPLLEKLGDKPQKKARVLVLTPTRELAAQVAESVRTYGAETKLRTAVVYGGVGYQPQIKAFRQGVDLIVATPGRLLDHLDSHNVDLSGVDTLVLDEADRMLDMGFIHDIRRVLKYLPSVRQRLMFSATFSKDIRKLATSILNKPIEIDVAPRNSAAESVDQRVLMVEKSRKRAALSHLIREGNWVQVLIFTRTKHGANRLAKQLAEDGISAAALHGNKSQNARTRALASFKQLDTQALVATDIAARGIDIDMLPHVVNFDLPNVPEDYVHRIGRTGRAGADGQALSLVGPDERKYLKDIEKLVGGQIERMTLPDIDLRDGEAESGEVNDPLKRSKNQNNTASQNKNSGKHHRGNAKTDERHPDKSNANKPAQRRRNSPGGGKRNRQRRGRAGQDTR